MEDRFILGLLWKASLHVCYSRLCIVNGGVVAAVAVFGRVQVGWCCWCVMVMNEVGRSDQ
jgi:hypothetical protein